MFVVVVVVVIVVVVVVACLFVCNAPFYLSLGEQFQNLLLKSTRYNVMIGVSCLVSQL